MDTAQILQKYEAHTTQWLKAIDSYTDIQFAVKPSAQDWSIGQVYDHLAQVTYRCVDNALQCAQGKGEPGHSGFGPAIFSMMGSFPPIKMRITKIPTGMEHIYNPKQITQYEAQNVLQHALKAMRNAQTHVQQADSKQRVKHWAGGWFNAAQWYHSAEMHIKHHFRQQKRIDAFLKK